MNSVSNEDRQTTHPGTGTRRAMARTGAAVVLLTTLTGIDPARGDAAVRSEEEAVNVVYETIAGRPATSDERLFWADRIADRGGRLELSWMLARDAVTSAHIRELYLNALGREPGPDETLYWTRGARHLGGLTAALAHIASSEEARTHAGSADGYVTNLYRGLLGREPDTDGLAHWSDQIADTDGAQETARTLLDSYEARGRRVRDAYRRVLGREPDPGGYLYWLSSGYDEPAISAFLAASDEIWRPSLPGELPFTFHGTETMSTILGETSVTFVVTFTARPAPRWFCEAIETGLRDGGAQIETPCTPDTPTLVGAYRGETLLVAASSRDTFTLTIGTPFG